jgi:hypothetical protein
MKERDRERSISEVTDCSVDGYGSILAEAVIVVLATTTRPALWHTYLPINLYHWLFLPRYSDRSVKRTKL